MEDYVAIWERSKLESPWSCTPLRFVTPNIFEVIYVVGDQNQKCPCFFFLIFEGLYEIFILFSIPFSSLCLVSICFSLLDDQENKLHFFLFFFSFSPIFLHFMVFGLVNNIHITTFFDAQDFSFCKNWERYHLFVCSIFVFVQTLLSKFLRKTMIILNLVVLALNYETLNENLKVKISNSLIVFGKEGRNCRRN